MSNLVIILGKSGTGKSTSIKTLNPKETVVLNPLGKRLPFKGSGALYNKENKNLFKLNNWNDFITYMESISINCPNIKNIIIDDACYIMRTEFFDRSKEKGYEKYNELADHFRKIIAIAGNLREDLNIFMMMHAEVIEESGSIIGYKVATVGRLLDKMYDPLENVTITLFSEPIYDDKGNPTFGFHTRRKQIGNIELPCKTPEGMFEEDFIPNDLNLLVQTMNKYYNE